MRAPEPRLVDVQGDILGVFAVEGLEHDVDPIQRDHPARESPRSSIRSTVNSWAF